jgi:hypothetical protein
VVKSFPFQNAKGGAVNAANIKPETKSKSGLQPVSISTGASSK